MFPFKDSRVSFRLSSKYNSCSSAPIRASHHNTPFLLKKKKVYATRQVSRRPRRPGTGLSITRGARVYVCILNLAIQMSGKTSSSVAFPAGGGARVTGVMHVTLQSAPPATTSKHTSGVGGGGGGPMPVANSIAKIMYTKRGGISERCPGQRADEGRDEGKTAGKIAYNLHTGVHI